MASWSVAIEASTILHLATVSPGGAIRCVRGRRGRPRQEGSLSAMYSSVSTGDWMPRRNPVTRHMEIVMNADMIRTVTDTEVLHLRDHGWVKLDHLISAEFAALLLDRAKACIGSEGLEHALRSGVDLATPFWTDYHDIVEQDECFASLALNPVMGTNAQRLIGRQCWYVDMVEPVGSEDRG